MNFVTYGTFLVSGKPLKTHKYILASLTCQNSINC